MKYVLLGTGSPRPNPGRRGAAVAVAVGENWLLFDAGRGAVLQLVRAGIPLRSVNPVFITHHHFDHIGDLFDVIISTWIDGRTEALSIFGPSGTADIVAALTKRVYARDIAFRTGESAARPVKRHNGSHIARLAVREIGAGLVYQTNHCTVTAELVKHQFGAEPPEFDWVCLGYRIEADGKVLVISGDTVLCEGVLRLARGADALIQCCYFSEADLADPSAKHAASYVLASSGQAGRIAALAGVKQLILTHFRGAPDDDLGRMAEEARQEFDGPVIVGHDLLEADV